MYTEALAREQAVRRRSRRRRDRRHPADVRAVVTAYEAVMRHYATSGYGDNALWQGGRLALDAFAQFGQPADKDTAVRLLRKLARPIRRASWPRKCRTSSPVPNRRPRPCRTPPVVNSKPLDPPKAPRTTAATGEGEERAPLTGKVATIKGIRRTVLADAVRITIELDGEVPFHDERIADPARVFVDLPGTRAAPELLDQTHPIRERRRRRAAGPPRAPSEQHHARRPRRRRRDRATASIRSTIRTAS
jgi:hypothetical protein